MATILPLDRLVVEVVDAHTGAAHRVPALHPRWKVERRFVAYRPPPPEGCPVALHEWVERLRFLTSDLDWLLKQPHPRFWSQVVFDEDLHKSLDSYVRLVTRAYDGAVDRGGACGGKCSKQGACEPCNLQTQLHRQVFMVYLRMSTNRESKECFLSTEAFAEVIYNNFLFDVPKILDLCALYGRGNGALLSKMIGNIFKKQPAYLSDLEESIPTILQVFDMIAGKCGVTSHVWSDGFPQKLTGQASHSTATIPDLELKDLLQYLCDVATTLFAFLDVYPAAAATFLRQDALSRISGFYEIVVPEMEKVLTQTNFEDKELQDELCRLLVTSQRRLLSVSHAVISACCLQPLLDARTEQVQDVVEEYLNVVMTLLQQHRFLADFDELYPIADDISIMQQASPSLDETRISYVLDAVREARQSAGSRRPSQHPQHMANCESPAADQHSSIATQNFNGSEDAEPDHESVSRGVEMGGVELASLVCGIRDLFPELGDGFIEAGLHALNYDSESLVSRLLDDTLPDQLKDLDRSMPKTEESKVPSLLAERRGVFDGDEFDVFSRDSVDLARVHKGKRPAGPGGWRSVLADRSGVTGPSRERYAPYGLVCDEEEEEPGLPGAGGVRDYDDEYDDTYDVGHVCANDGDADDDVLARRPFVTPRVLQTRSREDRKVASNYEVEEDNEDKNKSVFAQERPRDDFVMDPAVLREQMAAKRETLMANRGHRGGANQAVRGVGRGQGQSNETLVQRRRKEENKSKRGNHNRRAGASSKLRRGMIPS
ncbi:activating signal cointegrator 1 complex subunit 2 isoform X1 [Lethenteron reissneri]|uniref:activating signal cointegrator 1 complex subunit 2 isoform X1 n=1 Tax=Lethenteron reissneri TaxID=7753 RepID=UPI002AB67B66|nr:activating signal cointegrator 1 complex subunit 2 isoform X1 [Lethenteron reissneri]XP_061409947.1 activating signal cointegrator 1 complex subunit 2 isoform X1 [Lethenteron reissneri]